MRTTILLSGGGGAPTTPLPTPDLVIAADSGVHLAEELGLTVDLVVGDLDSATPASVAHARDGGADIEAHPTNKDATDLELGLEAAADRGAERVVVAGGGAGRLDHLLGIAMLITDDRWSDVVIEWHTSTGIGHVVRGLRTLTVTPGDIVSVLPATDVEVSIEGTRWPLDRALLQRGTTRGVSNEATETTVTVTIHSGVALVVTTQGETR